MRRTQNSDHKRGERWDSGKAQAWENPGKVGWRRAEARAQDKTRKRVGSGKESPLFPKL